MMSALGSGVLGLVRQKLIAHLFGAGAAVGAYTAAFELPDMINYLLIGGVASTTLVKLLTPFEKSGNHEEGDRLLSNVLNVMLLALAAVLLLAEVLAPLYVRVKFHNFGSPDTAALCVRMTRIMLPNPLLLFAGGVFGSRLLVRRIFVYQAMQPLLYNGSIIAGALLLHHRLGVVSLSFGAVGGAFLGFFAINLLGARRIGMRWTPHCSLRHPSMREWARLTLPLMLGQSLVTLDPWIRSYFAWRTPAEIAMMSYSRQMFIAPMNIVGPAVGAASLPFFASLWAEDHIGRFSNAVNRSVTRLIAVSLLLTGWMIALAGPIIDLALRGGSFSRQNAATAAHLFILFCLSLIFWTSQNLYARAFYAAGNTLTPMLSGTIVTVLSLPVYAVLFRFYGIAGLVVASDIGIGAHMIALAVLLHRKRMVSLAELEWPEIGKAVAASVAGAAAIQLALWLVPAGASHLWNLARLLAGSVVWGAVVWAVLLATRSVLPDALLRRRKA